MSDKRGKNPDAWLADESSVSRAYGELKQAAPPAHLDEIILAEARRAAASQDNTVIRVHRWRKWTMPAALAATVVFAVPLVIRVVDQTPTEYRQVASAPTVAATDTTTAERNAETTAVREQFADEPAVGSRQINEQLLRQLAPEGSESARLVGLQSSAPVTSDGSTSSLTDSSGGDIATTKPAEVATATTVAETPGRDDDYFDVDTPATPAAAEASQPAAVALADVRQDYAAAPPERHAGQVATSLPDEDDTRRYTGASAPPIDPGSDATDELKRTEAAKAQAERSRANRKSLAGPGVSIPADNPGSLSATQMRAEPEPGGVVEEVLMVGDNRRQEKWLSKIAKQYRRGKLRKARRELGSFLTKYPDYPLPTDFPLRKDEALYDAGTPEAGAEIVPEAASWLRGIGLMAERGDIDAARTQLAEFFEIYPDYPLPADFPLTRTDALPIEQ